MKKKKQTKKEETRQEFFSEYFSKNFFVSGFLKSLSFFSILLDPDNKPDQACIVSPATL